MLGVHSAKFPTEKLTESLADAVERLGIEHPVVNDADFEIWQSYAVRAWPTVVLIDPSGRVVATQAGEIDADTVAMEIETLLAAAREKGVLDDGAPGLSAVASPKVDRMLRYPSKLLPDGDTLWLADTGNHRVLEVELSLEAGRPEGRIRRVFGRGEAGYAEGTAEDAAFHHPRGLARVGERLLVADTDNHAVRAIDLPSGEVSTVAGTGEKGRFGESGGTVPTAVRLRSPWALFAEEEVVLIAMAGSHQLWALIGDSSLGVFAGNGREALVDGARAESSFNQPSDLAYGMGHLFVADSEASAVRVISFEGDPRVATLVGQGLFEFGDRDGVGAEVRLQHPTGLAFGGSLVYLADTYNHKIKTLDPTTGETRTLIGEGEPGNADGTFAEARLSEPEGVAVDGERLWIADTNNHVVRVADLVAGTISTLRIEP